MKELTTHKFRRSQVNWAKVLDGGIYELTQGEDFHGTIKNLRGTASVLAKRKGLKIRTSSKNGVIVIQAYKEGEGE